MEYTIEKVATLLGARLYGDGRTCSDGQAGDRCVAFLLTDSRSLSFPEETLFFALRTERGDGHKYISELYGRGVRAFVVSQLPENGLEDYAGATFLKVADVREALQRLAERHREEYDIPVVGITGSNGKTVVKEWLYQILSADKVVTRSPRSYNSQVGVPLSVWLLDSHTQVALFEAGISQPGEMQALSSMIQPTIGVLTSLGAAHQKNFASMEEKCREKLLLLRDARAVAYPMDDELVSHCVCQAGISGKLLGWSMNNPQADLYIKAVEQGDTMTTVTYIHHGREARYSLPFVDEASVQNSMACAAVALYLGVSPDVLAERTMRLESVAMRLEVKEGRNGCTLINDSYNSDINSLDIALDFMNRRSDKKKQRRTLILSDIEQSGESDESLYQQVAMLIEKRGVEKLIAIGPRISAQQEVFGAMEKYFFADSEQLTASGMLLQLQDELVLIKGARRFGFDQLTELLVQRVHETTLEVNLGAMVANLNYYRSFLHPDTKMVCMIKADGYGAGAVEIAKTLQDHRVDYLAVAVADEGVTLRRNGITSNIMVMNPEMSSFKTLFDYDLEPEIYSFRLLDALIAAAEREGITGWPVHIKIDTGMHRLGFNTGSLGEESSDDEIAQLITRLRRQTAVIPRSVFSHFVGSDSDGLDEFSASQFARFDTASRRLQQAFPHRILRHMDNSAGIEHFPERQLDMCRLGIGLYGVNPRTNQILSNVSTLKTTILQLRHVACGESIGYSRRTVLERDSVIAAIPIGYADGLDRHLGNRGGYCLVNGQRAAYVGNICMDVAMVDVTGIDCHEGDSVEIFGDHLPVTELSDRLSTIPYEVLTGISHRVRRIYFRD